MNGVFVTRSVVECIDAATKEGAGSTGTKPGVCDLQPGQLTLLMLSLLTSAIMLGSKLASFEIVRLKQQEMDRMEAERDTMLQELQEELEASLGSPEEAHEVEKIFAARRHSRISVFGPSSVLPVPVPAPAEAADSHLSAGSQVRFVSRRLLRFPLSLACKALLHLPQAHRAEVLSKVSPVRNAPTFHAVAPHCQ
jgi:hypothetical protein